MRGTFCVAILAAGVGAAVTAQQPFIVGQLAIKAANDVLDKKPIEKNQSVPVLSLSRTNPDGVKAFLEQLKALG